MELNTKEKLESYAKEIEATDDVGVLVDLAISLDQTGKIEKKLLDQAKAKLQKLALAEIENKNIKYVRYGGLMGSCEVIKKAKLEVDNFTKLKDALDAVLVEDKITRKQEVKYEVESKFKKALIALCKEDYARNDIDDILKSLELDEKAAKLAKKKLKGEYGADLALLHSLGCSGELEEELDAIREQKNFELISRYVDLEKLDMEALKKAVWLEDSTSITLNCSEG